MSNDLKKLVKDVHSMYKNFPMDRDEFAQLGENIPIVLKETLDEGQDPDQLLGSKPLLYYIIRTEQPHLFDLFIEYGANPIGILEYLPYYDGNLESFIVSFLKKPNVISFFFFKTLCYSTQVLHF